MDLDTAKQVALLLERENARLHTRIAELLRELAEAKGQDGSRQLELELMKLQEEASLLRSELFGPKSERRGSPKTEQKASAPRRGHGPRAQPELPLIEVEHDLDEEARTCPECGGVLDEWDGQHEESEEVTVVERRFVITRHKRKKYRCRCGGCVLTAPGPPKLMAGGRYSIDFAIEVATSKYLDHLPLERQCRIMRREGLVVDSQTLWDQLWALSRHLEPSYLALRDTLLERDLVHADETPWPLLGTTMRKGTRKWYVWCLAAPDAVFYRLRPSRSAKSGAEVLGGFEGIALVDGYKAYQTLARASPDLRLAYCWAHVRRKLVKAERFYPDEVGDALALVRRVFELDGSVPNPDGLEGEARTEALALRAKVRDEQVRLVVEELRLWALRQRGLKGSALRKAVDYMLGLWDGLVLCLDDPRVPLTNNLAERVIRGPVLGRKNHYGSKSERGTEVAAIFYSLLETAKLRGVEPKAYLLDATRAAIADPGTATLPSA